jgi:RNA polymerase sigma-70 factor (ECF subfamily)
MDGVAPPTPASVYSDEPSLLAALRAGKDDAFEYIVRAYSPRLMAVLQRMLASPDDAADALQEAFIQAFRNIGRFEGHAKLSTWLHRIAVNAALMKLRSKKRRPEASIEDLLPRFNDNGKRAEIGPTWTIEASDIAQNGELRELIRKKIDELPEDYRTIILMRDIEEMDTAEAAHALGITEGAVKTRLHRARLALRELLNPYFAESPAR